MLTKLLHELLADYGLRPLSRAMWLAIWAWVVFSTSMMLAYLLAGVTVVAMALAYLGGAAALVLATCLLWQMLRGHWRGLRRSWRELRSR